MSDERLRELERQWRNRGDIDSEASYLREQLRVGELSREIVELEAALGVPAYRLVLDMSGLTLSSIKDYERWIDSLVTFERPELLLRMLIALVAKFLPECLADLDPEIVIYFFDLERAYLSKNLPDDYMRVYDDAADFLRYHVGEILRRSGSENNAMRDFVDEIIQSLRMGYGIDQYCRVFPHPEYKSKSIYADQLQQVHEIIIREVLPWVLGTGDPVRERVDARIQAEVEEEVREGVVEVVEEE